jgi:hypothetical protein
MYFCQTEEQNGFDIKGHKETIFNRTFFSSPELKAQVSYSDRFLSVVCLLDFYIFDFFSRTAGPIVTKLAQIILR